jgi:hypothetical protein
MGIRVIGIMLDLLSITWLQISKACWLNGDGSVCVGAERRCALHWRLSVRNVLFGGHSGYLECLLVWKLSDSDKMIGLIAESAYKVLEKG